MSQDTDLRAADPVLARMADAILIPPFPGSSAPRWILDALGRGLGGVTLFGQNISAPGQVSALTAALRSAVAGDDPVIAIDEEGGDVTRVAYADGSPYPGNAALGAVDDVALTQRVHAAIGADLASLGINLDLAPCLDVLVAPESPQARRVDSRLRRRFSGVSGFTALLSFAQIASAALTEICWPSTERTKV